jgi:hypothetical protein
MASEADWAAWGKEVGQVFLDSIKPALGDVWDQAKDDLAPLGKKALKYWAAVIKGDKGAQIALESVQRKIRLIASRHLRDFEESVRAGFIKTAEVALDVCLRFLKILLK